MFNETSPLFKRSHDAVSKLDVKDCQSCYQVKIDVPGFKKDQLTVNVTDGLLEVHGCKSVTKEDTSNYRMIIQERYTGDFYCSIRLANIVSGNVTASLRDGVLTVTIPKAEPKKINITLPSKL
ncbi:HSP20-like chaperone [Globomyces pollinis-pini]|nr:HSP20-like chaperone [Globomyces pollinis-pini]